MVVLFCLIINFCSFNNSFITFQHFSWLPFLLIFFQALQFSEICFLSRLASFLLVFDCYKLCHSFYHFEHRKQLGRGWQWHMVKVHGAVPASFCSFQTAQWMCEHYSTTTCLLQAGMHLSIALSIFGIHSHHSPLSMNSHIICDLVARTKSRTLYRLACHFALCYITCNIHFLGRM